MIFSDHVTTPLHTLKSKVFPKLHSRFLMQMFRGRWEVGSLCFYSKNLSEVPETSLKIAVGQNLTTLGVVGTFGITSLPQRLISQSLYKEIILLQKLLDIGGKVLNPQKISLQPQKKGHFLVIDCVWWQRFTWTLDFWYLTKPYNGKHSTKSITMAHSKLFWYLFCIKMPSHLEF